MMLELSRHGYKTVDRGAASDRGRLDDFTVDCIKNGVAMDPRHITMDCIALGEVSVDVNPARRVCGGASGL